VSAIALDAIESRNQHSLKALVVQSRHLVAVEISDYALPAHPGITPGIR
jgi:hypothetical protein